MDLPKRRLGRTDLLVTTLGYGAFELRGLPRGRDVTSTQAETILNAVLDAGINFIDTSIDYGKSEELIGSHIAHRRSEYYLATKCGCLVGSPLLPESQPMPHVFTSENVISGVHQSLQRMRTDYIDVLQFHMSPSKKVLEEHNLIETVLNLKREGKVRFIGISSTLPNLEDHIAMGVFDVFQVPYSALSREHESAISDAARSGAGIVVRGGTGRGALSQQHRSTDAWAIWQSAKMDEISGEMSPTEFVLRFSISHPDVHTTIVGTINPIHLHENLKAVTKGPLDHNLYLEAKRRLTQAGVAPA